MNFKSIFITGGGGYDLNALKESVDYHVKSLLE
jgi:acetoin utilization deacetylase AcuC-like enzyme